MILSFLCQPVDDRGVGPPHAAVTPYHLSPRSDRLHRYLLPVPAADAWDSLGWAGGFRNGIEFAYGYDDIVRQYQETTLAGSP